MGSTSQVRGLWLRKLRNALVPDLRPSLTLGWKLVRARLARLKPRARWAAARGPMAALQLSPERLGWQADKPDEWTEADGTRWVVDDTLDTTAITHKVQAEVRASLWRRAADHWGRGAVDRGGDTQRMISASGAATELPRQGMKSGGVRPTFAVPTHGRVSRSTYAGGHRQRSLKTRIIPTG